MKITCIIDNESCSPLLCAEHGLSLCIQTENANILFDFGQSGALVENAEKLGIDLKTVDYAILSHGHYDHGGGIERFLTINDKAKIYIHSLAFTPKFNGEKYIGLNQSLKDNSRLVFTSDRYSISENVNLYSCNDKTPPFTVPNPHLDKQENGKRVPDDFKDEQYLCIKENGSLFVFGGCSHKGVLNALSWLTPDVYVGGFHVSKIEDKILLDFALELKGFKTRYYTCHCTGYSKYEYLKSKGVPVDYLSAGKTVIL